ncbi:MAG: DNA methyltransferase, partial [Planctomycetota bacterium]
RDILALEFKDLLEIDLKLDLTFDLTITGFSSPEIDALVTSSDTEEADMDDALPGPAQRRAAVSRLGDLWSLGEHRIICGNARERSTYEALMGEDRAAMGIHDAPYNVSIPKHVSKSGKHPEFVMGVGELSVPEFTTFNTDWLMMASAFSQLGAIQYAFMDWRHMGEMLEAGRTAGLELKNLAVWNKGVGGMGSLLRSQHELVFMFKEPSAPHINNVQLGKFGRNRTNVWDYPGAASLREELELHPTPKPVALVADAIRDVSNRNDLVLDAFSGSGTTIIAAASTGRRARVIELDPYYVDVAIRRWEAWSGERARHMETGLSFAELEERRGEGPAEAAAESTPASADVRVRKR